MPLPPDLRYRKKSSADNKENPSEKEKIMRSTTTHQGPIGKIFGSIILVIVGIGLFFLSGYLANRDANVKQRCSQQVQATVTGFEYSESNDTKSTSKASTPVFEYEYNGTPYTSHVGSYSSSYKDVFTVGQKYNIFIDPNDPMEIYSEDIAASDATMYKIMKWGGVALGVIGVFSLFFSIIKLLAIGGAIGFAASKILSKKKDDQ